MSDKTCANRIRSHWESRLEDLRAYMNMSDPYGGNDELGPFNEYGLAFDYVAPFTWKGQREGYWRFQISCGGPSEEVRFFGVKVGEYRCHFHRAEFWFLDWGDGASIDVTKEKAIRWLFDQFSETGTASRVFDEAMADMQPEDEEYDDE